MKLGGKPCKASATPSSRVRYQGHGIKTALCGRGAGIATMSSVVRAYAFRAAAIWFASTVLTDGSCAVSATTTARRPSGVRPFRWMINTSIASSIAIE